MFGGKLTKYKNVDTETSSHDVNNVLYYEVVTRWIQMAPAEVLPIRVLLHDLAFSVKGTLIRLTHAIRFQLQSNCRLFVFDTVTHSWREKGRGVLRLNDMCQSMTEGIFQSRLGEVHFCRVRTLCQFRSCSVKFTSLIFVVLEVPCNPS